MTDGMKRASSLSKEERKLLIQRGFEWARTFTWKKVAHETIEVYKKTIVPSS
jgi:hypothetical protein